MILQVGPRAAEPSVERRQRAIQLLCQRNVPCVLAGQVAAQSPYPLSKKARRETTPCPAAADLHGRCWPRYAISPHPFRAGAGYCRPHQSQPPTGQPALAKCTICPTCPPVPSRPALPCSRMRRRPSSRSVRVAPAQDLVRFYPCSRRRFPLTNSLQPCGCGGPRRDALQLYAQEFLHRLALARREFVAELSLVHP